MTLLTSSDLFSGVAPAQGFFTQATGFCVIRQKYWAWLAPMAERPLVVLLMRDIDVAVALGNHTEVFTFSHIALARHSEQAPSALALRNGLSNLLAAGGELGDSTCGSGLGGLSAGVGVHLGVDDDVAHCI